MINLYKHPGTPVTGFIISMICQFFGGFDALMKSLIMFMVIDFVTGFVSAAFFKSSDKTVSGKLESRAWFKGLIKKGCSLILIGVGVHLDALTGTGTITRDAVVILFIINELISILENMGKMGIKLPEPIMNALGVLKNVKK